MMNPIIALKRTELEDWGIEHFLSARVYPVAHLVHSVAEVHSSQPVAQETVQAVSAVCLAADVVLPAAHLVHEPALAADQVPIGHSVQAMDLAAA